MGDSIDGSVIMRGEETEVFGIVSEKTGKITSLTTFITGEMIAALSK